MIQVLIKEFGLGAYNSKRRSTPYRTSEISKSFSITLNNFSLA